MPTSTPLVALWEKICVELQQVVSCDAVERWFRPLSIASHAGGVITLTAENSIYTYWIEENYLPQLEAVASRVTGEKVKVAVAAATDADAPVSAPVVESATASGRLPAPEKRRSNKTDDDSIAQLNDRSTFDNFVVGVNNELAHAASTSAAKAPGRCYNPLFLHGSVGLGKTHLMQAIGRYIHDTRKNLRVCYTTSEQFTNEFIASISNGELPKFRKKYRQVDVLLIDDIQFLGGKERSQEEFFHTFNSLHGANNQIVLTCDSPPHEIANLQKRLCSRFEQGLTAALQPPDLETRIAILKRKMSAMPQQLPEPIIRFIAERVKSNVRRLEGALTRVAAYAALQGTKDITEQSAETLLKDLLQQETRPTVSIDSIQRKVAETYDIRLADMTSKRRPANIALPRMVAMYLSRRLTPASLHEIGDAFGGRDHGTVIHAAKTIDQRMALDASLRATVGYLVEKLESSPAMERS